MTLEEQKYPIGKFQKPTDISENDFKGYIRDIRTFTQRLKEEVQDLSYSQLDTPYREGGWTIRQVVNHCADSHMNGIGRLKLALTEDRPTIKPYYEARWAELPDTKKMPIDPALKMLQGMHERWAALLQSLSQEQRARTFLHPEDGKEVRVDESTAVYAWHGNHHLAHITSLKERMEW